MKIIMRIFTALWICGTVCVLSTNNSSVFHWIGLSRMDVFNATSIESTKYRISYYRDGGLLPFMSPSGENLSWFKNENFKYRTYMGMAFSLMMVSGDVSKAWEKSENLFLRMVFYDFCRENYTEKNYTIKFFQEEKLIKDINWKMTKDRIPEKLNSSCLEARTRFSLL